MFIQTESTPNPETMKFIPGVEILESGSVEFRSISEARNSPLATKLFVSNCVKSVFFSSDFIAVTKNENDWEYVRPIILGTILEHFASGEPIITGQPSYPADQISFNPADKEIVEKIKVIIAERVIPAVARDGGSIIFKGYNNGTVSLKMEGACAGCPSSTITLRYSIENLLKTLVPEVKEIVDVTQI